MSQNQTQTATATDFDLTPPDPVPTVAPEKAAGLVPVSDEVKKQARRPRLMASSTIWWRRIPTRRNSARRSIS